MKASPVAMAVTAAMMARVPCVVESELADTITDASAAEAMQAYRQIALKPEAIAAAIAHVIDQPSDVDTSEIVVRPTASA
ncbi:hypothetical protein [Aidingimonas halophila]|nr:hypothetical protein [Aidingimonas halophila]